MPNKLPIHGGPVTPAHLLEELAGESFCVSYMDRRQDRAAGELVGPGGMLLLDNGAFTAWRKGLTLDAAHWAGFYRWADELLERFPHSVAVIPDVIDGELRDNQALIDGCPLPADRVMPVWHLHEPLAQLRRLATRFDYVALGSSGIYATPGTPSWRARMAQTMAALAMIKAATGRRPWVHMMRGLGLLHEWSWDSADSSNIARNHNRTRGQDRHVAAMAARIRAKIEAGGGRLAA